MVQLDLTKDEESVKKQQEQPLEPAYEGQYDYYGLDETHGLEAVFPLPSE